MNPKYVRTTVENLLADLARNPGIGRRPSFMGRYGRPFGLGLALGIGGAAGCADSGGGKQDALPPGVDGNGADRPALVDTKDALPAPDTRDALPAPDTRDALPAPDTRDALPPAPDVYGLASDLLPAVDTRDALPLIGDAYGITVDTRDALPLIGDAYGITVDTRDALPPAPDAYGMMDRPVLVDTKDGAPPIDGGAIDGGQG